MLEVSDLTRLYGDFVAVDRVGFSIGQGEIVGLLGHNGAGKTTIMKMLSGYLEPNQGRISIDGIDLTDDAKQVQRTLGYLPESLPIYPEMSVADYLDYAAELKGLTGDHKYLEIKRAIGATAIADRLLSPISTLSRGYKQRVGVAQAILGQPRLLILDEPTNGLDPTQTEQMRRLIRDLAQDATVILSTHIMQEVEALCDRALILRNGRLAVDARLDELRHSNHLLIATTLAPQSAEQRLRALNGIENLEVLSHAAEPEGGYRYRLTLSERDACNTISAALAKSIIEAGAELYQLHPEQRDLETLFREVSNATVETKAKEELSDAA
ncbi:ABC transporter ATP-binding protein [Methylomarinum sp. Ch1-1]|uniref:ABC transporter ATP-binding protein n=1 Tax=Methylomarinum roseum TaxID=3067653 RepID=A0AAU7NS64_9GAMM|nr:ABC transporter ATP-binding protein [Methylomarinum sp. Ch1-1]MDP4520535.1 ABC transporter ATP-binding protein [Methylomarinum sp. Ch1-1]